MKKGNIKFDTRRITSFISDNKMFFAALGGITIGVTLAALMGNEKARHALRSMGTSIADLSGKFVDELGGYKQLLSPLLAKSDVQGL